MGVFLVNIHLRIDLEDVRSAVIYQMEVKINFWFTQSSSYACEGIFISFINTYFWSPVIRI